MRSYDMAQRVLDISPLDVLRFLRRCFNSQLPEAVPDYRLSKYQTQVLEAMRRDLEIAEPPFKPSLHWRRNVSVFDELFRAEGIQNPEEQGYNLCFSGFSPSDPRLHRYVCWMYRSLLARRDSLGLLSRLTATCKEGRGYAYEIDDRLLSLDLLLSIDDFYSLYELNPAVATQPLIIAELGAGWGRLGYVLCQVNPHCTYVIFDLPEVLLISQSYLPTLFPGISVQSYDQSRNCDRFGRGVLQNARLWFLTPQDMLKFDTSSVDLVVNIASFQEMPVNYVAKYFNYFSQIASSGHSFVRQLRDGRSHQHSLDEIPGIDHYPFPTYWKRKFLRSSTLSDEFFEAGFFMPAI